MTNDQCEMTEHAPSQQMEPFLRPSTASVKSGAALQWGFVVLSLGLLLYYMLPVTPGKKALADIFTIFLSIVLEALPFMLIGSLAGGFIEEFVPREKLTHVLSDRKVSSVFIAAGMGLIFPVCECAVIPVVRRLLKKGVSFSAAVAYMLAGPIVNPIVAGSTAVAYMGEWQVVALRLVSGFVIALVVGFSMGHLFKGTEALKDAADQEESCHSDSHGCGCGHPDHDDHPCAEGSGPGSKLQGRLVSAFQHAGDDFLDVARFLVMGAFFAGVLRGLIAESTVLGMMVNAPFAAIPLMMILAMALNLCSEADAFVAASFRSIIPFSGQLAFMVLGPMLDVKLLLMYLGIFRHRAIVSLASMTFLLTFLIMVLIQTIKG